MVAGEGTAEEIGIFDDGHVLFRNTDVEVPGFYTWSGGGTAELLSKPLAGQSVEAVHTGTWNSDGSVIAYPAFSPAAAEAGDFRRRLFHVGSLAAFTLPTTTGAARLIDTRLTTPVAPSTKICIAAVGAKPGDYIGVNVTPAGATANVNFGPGTIDPNVAFVKIGTDGEFCFTNSEHGTVNVIIDELIVSPS